MPRLTTLDRETEVANLVSTYESEFPLIEKTYLRDSVLKDLVNARKELQVRFKDAGFELPDMAEVESVGVGRWKHKGGGSAEFQPGRGNSDPQTAGTKNTHAACQ